MTLDLRWRFVATRLNGRLLTLLDRRSTARKVTYTLNKAAVASGVAPADSPEINIVQGDGFPMLAEGVRNIYGFRNEGPWVCRFAGRVLQLEDNATEGGVPYANWTAYDPRQLLYARPVVKADGSLPGPNGLHFEGVPASEIAVTLLQRTIDTHGEVGIDPAGSIETTDPSDFHFEQGASVGEAWDQLNASGEIDITLTPIYDPLVRPGMLAELDIAALAGSPRYKAPFAWDRPTRSLVGINRLVDGTQRANRVKFFAGQGGPGGALVSDFASIATYGEYWAQQFFPGQNIKNAVELEAATQLAFRKNGVTTFKVNPAPVQASIRTPLLWLDYFLGDQVPIYASKNLREAVATLQRVYEVPVELRDDGTETISQLSFSADGVGGQNSDGTGDDGGGGDGGVIPPPGGTDPYFYEPFDGSYDTSKLSQEISAPQGGVPTGSFSYVAGDIAQAVRLAVPAQSSGAGGRLVSLYLPASRAHSGYSGVGVLGAREESFYRVLTRWPTGYQPSAGDWNWWFEWHNDGITAAELRNHGNPGLSCTLGIRGLGATSPTPVGAGTSPTFVVQMNGGPVAAPDYEKIYTGIAVPVDDDFHEVICHFVWDERDAFGFAEVIIDGVTLYSQTRATLHTRDDGSLSYNTHGIYNYRLVSTVGNAIDFDEWRVGPDLASVGG